MNPEFRRIALIVASLGLILSLFFALRDDDDGGQDATPTTTAVTTAPPTEPPATTAEPPPTTTAPAGPVRITLRGPGGKLYRGSVKQGRKVVIVVRSTVADHAHLHGYDLMADVAPGKPGRISFTATIPGKFEIELEDRRLLLAVLEVRP